MFEAKIKARLAGANMAELFRPGLQPALEQESCHSVWPALAMILILLGQGSSCRPQPKEKHIFLKYA